MRIVRGDMKLLLGTNNKGKIIEMRSILDSLPQVELVLPSEIRLNLNIEEHGSTYYENAALKARAFATASGFPCVSDDSGLEVDALDGAPGLHSARFSPLPGATDADRRSYLIEKLAGLPRPWAARFRCIVALTSPAGELQFFEGLCPGEIIPEERGQRGFGYDPIFFVLEYRKTMAELCLEEKNRVSHRGRALAAARPAILAMLKGLKE
jgi:XTP/dITP diphosphohydrolase